MLASVSRFAAWLQRGMTQGMTGHMKAVRDDGSPTALLFLGALDPPPQLG